MNKKLKAFFVFMLLMASSYSMAAVLDIDFNGNQFLLGTFDSAETGVDFYNYGSPFASSANPVFPGTSTPIPLTDDALQIFTHVDTNTNELSFGIILEKPNGSGGSFNTTIDWSDPATLAFVDDPGETGTLGTGGPQTLNFNWLTCCTDGFVISGFDPNDLFIDLLTVSGDGLSEVIFLSPDGQNTVFNFPQDTFSISIQDCNPDLDPDGCIIPTNGVPLPGTLALLGAGLVGLGLLRRKKC